MDGWVTVPSHEIQALADEVTVVTDQTMKTYSSAEMLSLREASAELAEGSLEVFLGLLADRLGQRIGDAIVRHLGERAGQGGGTGSHEKPMLLTAREAAQRLGLSTWEVWELARRGDLPCVRHGRRVFFEPETLLNWVRSKRSNGEGPPR